MRPIINAVLLAMTVVSTGVAAAEPPSHIGKRVARPEDTRAIQKVIDDFQTAIKTKNTKLLSSLVVDEKLLWTSPPPPAQMRELREKIGPQFNGISPDAFRGFSHFISTVPVPVEERFYNVQITQDDNVAWVMFDYEFVQDNHATNHGVETWQMMKSADGAWKIASVFWSTHMLP